MRAGVAADAGEDSDVDSLDDVEVDELVAVCYAGRLAKRESDGMSHETHKVGGAPVPILDDDASTTTTGQGKDLDENIAVERATRDLFVSCERCGETMTLVAQTYAPVSSVRARALYVYACVRTECAGKSWVCVRGQKANAGGEDDVDGVGAKSATTVADWVDADAGTRVPASTGVVELAPAMVDDWDNPDASDWCGGGGDGDDADALAAELDAMLATSTSGASASASSVTTNKANAKTDNEDAVAKAVRKAYNAACSRQLVEYYVVADSEPMPTKELSSKDASRVAELLAEYAEREGVSVDEVTAAHDMEADTEWGGETYESSVATNVDFAYLKFNKRLQRAPDQCMRYEAKGMKFLWPNASPPQPPKCSRCGASCVCELQFTPALLRDVEDAVGMHKGEKSYLASEEELLAWDWQTVCVFTCPDSCGADAGAQGEVRYVRESVVVAESEASGDSLLKAMQQ